MQSHAASAAVTVTISAPTDSPDISSFSPNAALPGMEVTQPRTPPDQASIQSSMDRNKETLKRKLMLRRSVNELVDRGIYPPLKTPPALAQKARQLERAKTGDLLRHKIQQRPDRQVLVQQHILEDTTIDPSLHEAQRLLKRSRLLDGLNGKLAHRPGPLELVQGNILQPSLELANAIKDGTIQFIPTCSTEEMDQSGSSFTFDDENAGSDCASSPSMDESSSLSDISSPSSAPPVPSSESFPISFTFTKGLPQTTINKVVPQVPVVLASTSAVVTTSISTPKPTSSQLGTSSVASALVNNNTSSKSRSKKPKPKAMSRGRIIKFHEYKGPPSVVRSQSASSSTTIPPANTSNSVEETPYHIMLQQQQLFLQWQLEFQQKHHQQGSALAAVSESAVSSLPSVSSIVATSPIMTTASAVQANSGLIQSVTLHQPLPSSSTVVSQTAFSPEAIPCTARTSILQTSSVPSTPPPPPPLPPPSRPTQPVAPRQATKPLTSIPASALSLPKLTGNLEEMKVADLKAELKKRSLPVSGPKPQLIERLKPFTQSSSNNNNASSSSNSTTIPSRTPSHIPTTAVQIGPATFQIKTEPNGDVTASSLMQPSHSSAASMLSSSFSNGASNLASIFSMPVTFPMITQDMKTIVSVKPMVKEEPVTTTDISPPCSPPTLKAATPGPTTPMSPEYEANSPPNLIPKLGPQPAPFSQGQVKPTGNHLLPHHNNTSMNLGQTVVSMNIDTSQPASVVPAEMMPMEIDAVSIDLNQGVDDMAFKAASLGYSLDHSNFKALIQRPTYTSGFKTVGLTHPVKAEINDSTLIDANALKTINLSPNLDATAAAIKTANTSPNTDISTTKSFNLDSSSQSPLFKIPSLSPSSDPATWKTSPTRNATAASSTLKVVRLPLMQVSSTQASPVHMASPVVQTLATPASVLQLQQLQTLQQQLLQQQQQQHQQQGHGQVQHQQHQVPQQQQQSLPRQPTALAPAAAAATFQLTNNDLVVLAQAKQIEELQRMLQESHLKLKLQQLQQQQQHQQQQQQQLWQVQIPANFNQNSLLTKLAGDQLTIIPQNGQVVAAPLQLQQEQPTQDILQTKASSVVQHSPASILLNGNTVQPAQLVVSGTQQGSVQLQHLHPPIVSSSQNVACAGNDISNSIADTAEGRGGTSNQIAGPPPPSAQPMMKSQGSYVFTAVPSTSMLIAGHTNGIISRTSSVPPSSMASEQQKLNVQCCSSSPFFSGPLKEPPRYDEAIKTKQKLIHPQANNSSSKVLASSNSSLKALNLGQIGLDMKSQTMDDVLEILIRNGELPPNAANEPLPTPKIPEGMILPLADQVPVYSSSVAGLSFTSTPAAVHSSPTPSSPPTTADLSATAAIQNISNKLQAGHHHHHSQPSSVCITPRDQTLTSVHTGKFLNDTHSMSPHSGLDTSGTTALNLNEALSHPDDGELVDWEEMLPSPDLCSMDWSTESGFGQYDLVDSGCTTFDSRMVDNLQPNQGQNSNEVRYRTAGDEGHMNTDGRSILHCHNDNSNNNIIQGSESDFVVLGLNGDSCGSVDPASQMDMSEWLDVIMPNSSISLDSINMPSSNCLPFSADSVLTPRTQQEVLDILNFDDPDFCSSAVIS